MGGGITTHSGERCGAAAAWDRRGASAAGDRVASAAADAGGACEADAPPELFLQVHVTTDCNLSCRHCYLDDGRAEMPVGLFSAAVSQFHELVARKRPIRAWVQVTGGEPLLHPRIWELLELVAARRLGLRLLTNGTLVGPREARRLGALHAAVQVSLDGRQAAHDRWRGDGAHAAAVAGLRALGDAGVTRAVRVTAAGENAGEVLPLYESLAGLCEYFSVSRVVPEGGCAVTPPGPEAYREVVYALYGRRGGAPSPAGRLPAVRMSDPFFGPLLATDYPDTRYEGCSAGRGGLCVVEDGTVYPCRRLPVAVGSVATGDLATVYDDAPLVRALRERDLGEPCASCEDRGACGGSRCLAFAASGDPLAGEPACIY